MMSVVRRRTEPTYKRCAFTGYRPQKMVFGFNESDPRCIEFKARLRATIEDLIGKGYAHFISGGAMGMDMFAAEAVLELREEYPWIMLEMVSPFDGQAGGTAMTVEYAHNMDVPVQLIMPMACAA